MTPKAQIPLFTLFGETTTFPDVVHCERVLDRAGLHEWVISPHRHAQMAQVFRIDTGHARVMLDGATSHLNDGAFLYVPPQVVHGFTFARGTEGLVLSVPSAVMARLGPRSAALTGWLAAPQQGSLTPEARSLSDALAAAYADAGSFRAQRLVALTHALIATLAEGGGAPGMRHGQLQRLDALILRQLGSGWTARDYAAALHVTAGHLNRVVRAEAGMSLTAYLETAVMTEACRLIAFTRLPVAEVGYRLGYGDPPYFSRRFRARMGETPSAYRARVSGAT